VYNEMIAKRVDEQRKKTKEEKKVRRSTHDAAKK
jgi:hypothetical protein